MPIVSPRTPVAADRDGARRHTGHTTSPVAPRAQSSYAPVPVEHHAPPFGAIIQYKLDLTANLGSRLMERSHEADDQWRGANPPR